MYTIICDSATNNLYMALLKDNLVIEEKIYSDNHSHVVNITSGIDEMLKKAGIKAKDINKFVCGIGPGSYTGSRMAVTVAKMFGSFLGCEVYKISTLAIMSSSYNGNVLSYIDARNGNCFGGIFNDLNPVVNESFILLDELKKNNYDICVNTLDKVDPLKVIAKAIKVDDIDLLVPNYLRDTEAERNLNAKIQSGNN